MFEVSRHSNVDKAVESKIEESIYHLVCLEVLSDKLFSEEISTRQIQEMKGRMLQLLKESRRTS